LIFPVSWSSAIGVKSSNEGTSGVFFVEVKDQGALVIKGSSTIGADMFSSCLAEYLGIRTPQSRVVSYLNTNEWDPMVQQLWKLEATNNGDGRGSKLSKCLLRPFLILQEFIPGVQFDQFNTENSKLLLQSHVLKDIGSLIAFDMLINNWDRLPFIWKNDGNPKNIIFDLNQSLIYGIDNSITSIDITIFSSNFQSYKREVDSALNQIFDNPNKESTNTKRVRDFIKLYSGIDIGEIGCVQIQLGIIETVKQASKLQVQEIERMKANVEGELMPTMDLLGISPDIVGINKINIQFLSSILETFAKHSVK